MSEESIQEKIAFLMRERLRHEMRIAQLEAQQPADKPIVVNMASDVHTDLAWSALIEMYKAFGTLELPLRVPTEVMQQEALRVAYDALKTHGYFETPPDTSDMPVEDESPKPKHNQIVNHGRKEHLA